MDVKAKVLESELDRNNNILVSTEYTLPDGSKKTGHTRYAFHNYSRAKVQEDVNIHCDTLVKRIYQVLCEERINKRQRHINLMNEVKIDDITASCNQTEIELNEIKDVNGNIIQDAKRVKVTIEADGEIKEEVIRDGKPPVEEIIPE